jgi:hypothetical protein
MASPPAPQYLDHVAVGALLAFALRLGLGREVPAPWAAVAEGTPGLLLIFELFGPLSLSVFWLVEPRLGRPG